MARKSRHDDVLKEGSSFRKVFASFMLTSEWKQMNQEFCKGLDEAFIDRNEFGRYTSYAGSLPQPAISVHFVVKYPIPQAYEQECPIEKGNVKSSTDFHIVTGQALAKSYMNEIVTKNFGKKSCPTYNCKVDTVREYWPEFGRKALMEANKAHVEACETRLRAEFALRIVSPELAQEHQHFYERGAIDEIRKVVLKYYGKVTVQVIQDAMREVAVESILES